jgi:hypothetical protein
LKQSCRTLHIIVGIWTPNSAGTVLTHRLATAGPDAVVTTMKGALQQLALRHTRAAAPARDARPAQRQENLHIADTSHQEPEELFDAIKRETAKTFEVPLAFVTIVQLDAGFWKDHRALPHEAEEMSELLRNSDVCSQISDAPDAVVVVADVSKDKRLAEDPFLLARGIQSYLAVPLATEAGHVVGGLCVLDTKPRAFKEGEVRQLQALGNALMKAIESRPAKAA